MNPKKVCFIYCVNDERQLDESLKYLAYLEIPEGFEIDVITVREAGSMTAGYNYAMNQSDAKYKVYLHQDVFIINKRFIYDISEIFSKNTQLGMLGVVGAGTIPTNAVWRESDEKYGKVFDSHSGNMSLLSFKEVQSNYKIVKALDGCILVTQYDLPWRSDLFNGWHFYDLSQCMEFIKEGYEVGVPFQTSPWCIHDCGFNNYAKTSTENRRVFLEEYSQRLFPLVSVMIPTYNRPHYFELALKSVLDQTYNNIEIIICDDSTNDETFKVIQPYLLQYSNIRYYKNEQNLGQFKNDLKCMELANGEYVNFLMDDDLFAYNKIERMMSYFLSGTGKEVSLVTSHRQLIDSEGNLLDDMNVTTKLFSNDTITDGIEFGDFVISRNANVIGEPSTVLFRKKDLEVPFGTFAGKEYGCNVDTATWVNLLSKGKIVYISETLSYFRLHDNQQLHSNKMIVAGMLDYCHIVLNAPLFGFLSKDETRIQAIKGCLNYINAIVGKLGDNFECTNEYEQVCNYQTELEQAALICERPLVSVLIPTYNRPHYLEQALQSVLIQTYSNIEVIVCDNSTNDDTAKLMRKYISEYPHITYIKNEKNIGAFENFLKCQSLANGQFINFLMDDDLFHPTKIERMIKFLLDDPQINLVTCVRERIDENGNTLPHDLSTRPLVEHDTIIDGIALARKILVECCNYIGEPSACLFRKDNVAFGTYQNVVTYKLTDVATWLEHLTKGKGVYIAEPLCYLRVHAGQDSGDVLTKAATVDEWYELIEESRKNSILTREDLYFRSLQSFLRVAIWVMGLAKTNGQSLRTFSIEKYCHAALSELVRLTSLECVS
ncbi:glycosyltransferase [Paenibacillus sp. NPDC056579]|uniref:glycosyltransferase n=1 Tax=Paenibacillus sp. NPDC056579 TaxID=3345871 RepID=UPI0036B29079